MIGKLVYVSTTLTFLGTALFIHTPHQIRYELPLDHARHFWEPPARLLVRLDGARGTGVHLTPGGLEFDEQVGVWVCAWSSLSGCVSVGGDILIYRNIDNCI